MWEVLCNSLKLEWWERLIDIIPIIVSLLMAIFYLAYHDHEEVTPTVQGLAGFLLVFSTLLLLFLLWLSWKDFAQPINLAQNTTSNKKEAEEFLLRHRQWHRSCGTGLALLLVVEVLISFELDVGWDQS